MPAYVHKQQSNSEKSKQKKLMSTTPVRAVTLLQLIRKTTKNGQNNYRDTETMSAPCADMLRGRPSQSLRPWHTGWSIKRGTLLLSISSTIINRFSKFFHWHTLRTICNNVIITHYTTPWMRVCTTLWNINEIRMYNNNKQTF